MSGMISQEIVEQVRQACDIVDIIGGYVPLKKSGSKYKALSPFNKEKTPSFYVDPARQMFKCFSSGHGGDVFKFLMVLENMTFPEAVRRLAQRVNIPIPERNGPYRPELKTQKEALYALHAGVAAWWHQLLKTAPEAEPARAYLQGRDFPLDLAAEFGLGYAPEGWDATLQWAQKAGHRLETLEMARLIATSESGRRYDFFRGRLMIPIHDEAGQVVAFSGRLLDPEAKAQKYVNSPETPIFQKSRILFGLNKTKRPIIEAESALLCEGQIDLMRCWQAGIRHVVAPQGTAFTEAQARILKRLAQEVVVCFDADRAGQNAAERSIDLLMAAGLNVRVARMPQGEDPDSLLRRQPPEVFRTLLEEAKDYSQHLLDTACEAEDTSTPRGRGAVAAKMAELLLKMPNAVVRESFLLEVARRLQVTRAVLDEEVKKIVTRQRLRPAPAPAEKVLEKVSDEPIEIEPLLEELLALLLTHPEQVPEVTRRLDPRWLEARKGAALLQDLLEAHAAEAWEDAAQFMAVSDEPVRDYLSGLLMELPPLPTESMLELYAEKLVRRLEIGWMRSRLEILEQEIKSPLLTPEQISEKLKEMIALRQKL